MEKSNKGLELYRPSYFGNEVILVDGHTRSGKSMLGPILCGFEGVELPTIPPLSEKLSFLYYHKKIKKDAAITLLKTELQHQLFYGMLARNVNFKLGDYSSVLYNATRWKYLKRIFLKDREKALQKIKDERTILQVQTHDTLGYLDLFLEIYGSGVYVLEMIRHPVDLIFSNYRKGYGKREEESALTFLFTLKYKDTIVPWYTHGWEEKYLSLPQIDKVIHFVYHRLNHINIQYQKLTSEQKKQVLFLSFDDFIIDPWQTIDKIEMIIKRKTTSKMAKILRKQKLPGSKDKLEVDRKKKEEKIRSEASPHSIVLMEKLIKEYEQFTSTLKNV